MRQRESGEVASGGEDGRPLSDASSCCDSTEAAVKYRERARTQVRGYGGFNRRTLVVIIKR